MLIGIQITPRLLFEQIKLLTHNVDIGEWEGVLIELSLSFFREILNKLCFIKLTQDF